MKLRWSPEAIDDLVSIRDYVARDDPAVAVDVVRTIMAIVAQQLPRFPHAGRAGRVDGTRELVVPGLPFIVPYRVRRDVIEVVRVYHASRRWPDSF
jgi:toxin ParE1/3/4